MSREILPRRERRRNIALAAQCRTQSGLRGTGRISDLTTEGCCVITTGLFVRVGVRVVIRPDGMEGLPGVVRWISGNRAGVEFERPLYGPVVDHLVTRYSAGRPVKLSRC